MKHLIWESHVFKLVLTFLFFCSLTSNVFAALTVTVVENSANADINGDSVLGDDLMFATDLDDILDFPGVDSIVSNDAVATLLTSGDLTLFSENGVTISAPIVTFVTSGLLTLQTQQANISAAIAIFAGGARFIVADGGVPAVVNINAGADMNVFGGTANDSIIFANAGSLGGAIDGGTGTDTLTGDDDGNAFTIGGADAGVLTGKASGFSNIENLTGGAGVDTYKLDGGSIAGTINGLGNGDLLQGRGSIAGGFSAGAGATVAPGVSPEIINSGDVSFSSGSNFDVELDDTTPGTGGHDQLNVTGTVALGGAAVNVSLGFSPSPGDVFVIINNDGVDAVNGTFGGLAEGDSIAVGATTLVISYLGGDGNDVILYSVNPVPVPVPVPTMPLWALAFLGLALLTAVRLAQGPLHW